MSKDINYRRMINSTRWLRLRKGKLKESPLCEDCKAEGKYTAACEIHHVRPCEWAGYNVFWCTHTQVSLVVGYEGGRKFTVAYDSSVGGFTLTNNSDRRRGYGLIYQNIPIP